MAYLDHAAEAHDKECKEKYEELKKFISSLETKGKNKGKVSEWWPAYEHVKKMENTIERQQKKLQEYQSFFSSLSALMPRQHSIHDILG